MEKSYLEEKVVNINYRYVSAWNEVNTRIAQRQSVSNHYITTVSIFFSIGLGIIQWAKSKETGLTGDLLLAQTTRSELIFNCILITLPILTVYFYLLNYKHEFSIKVLRKFLKDCETFSLSQNNTVADLPSYHNGPFIKEAASYRRFHDYANILMMALLNILAMLGVVMLHKEFFRWDSVFTWGAILVSLIPPILMFIQGSKLTRHFES